MPRPSILTLSLAQALGLVITSLGGVGAWLAVVALADPADLGALGRIVSTGTFVASLVTAGLGQFLLSSVGATPIAALRPLLARSLLAGGGAAAVAALLAGLAQRGLDASLAALVLLAVGIALTNLQDGVYLAVGMAADVPAKGAAIVLLRLALLGALWLVGASLPTLAGAFVLAQLVAGGGWGLVRVPAALRRHRPRDAGRGRGHAATLGLSYLYAIAVTAISAGLPALATSVLAPAEGGLFFLAWTIAGLLAGVAVGVANAVLATSAASGGGRLLKVLGALAALLGAGGAGLFLMAPRAVAALATAYDDATPILATLILGQFAFGLSLVGLAFCRATVGGRELAALIVTWALVILGGAVAGLGAGALGCARGFALGSALTVVPVCAMAAHAGIRTAAVAMQVERGR